MPLTIVWRNPMGVVQAHLRMKETSNPYYGWAKQGTKIQALRTIWGAEAKLEGMSKVV